jgi:preprotein translocase subunit YajC
MREYDVLLINKIILTVIAFVVLYTLWFLAQRKRSKAGSTGS